MLNACHIVVDVGGVYDPLKHRYDHHQRDFNSTMEIGKKRYETRLSSAGLIYKHFGREVIGNICGWNDGSENSKSLDCVYQKLYESFVEGFDGIDNGVSQYPSEIKPKYEENTNIAARVSRLMPWWNQPVDDAILDERFKKAVEIVGSEFAERVLYTFLSWLPAREIVQKALDCRFTVDASGHVVVFDVFVPWKEHLLALEKETEKERLPLYVVYPDSSKSW